MPACPSCPDRSRLRDLLDGALPDDEQAALTEHLDGCTRCQQDLEGLAAGPLPWTQAVRRHRQDPVELGEALCQAMAELRGDTGLILADEDQAGPEDGSLSFLTPSDRPGALGHFGPYEVVEVLGRGGMGVVLKAIDPTLNRVVAVKVLAPQLAASPTARRRFAREARAAAAVSHENAVSIHHVDSAGGLPYLVMQYVPGISLQQRLDAEGPLPLREVVRIGMETALGLAAAHAQGLIHRDVKPANILLEDGGGRVRLTDFGLARLCDDASMTLSNVLVGTPQYMAPEQARGEPVDQRADLFSLGSVLYAMCTGRPPFRASTTLAVLRRVSDDAPRPAQEINPDVPDWLVKIMNRLHTKDPERRFRTAAEVSGLLAHHLDRLEGSAHNPDSDRRTPVAHPRRWAWAAVPALLVLVLVATETLGVTRLVEWAATVLRVRTPEGTLVIEVSDPSVKVSVDGSEVVISGAGVAEVRLRAGAHKVKAVKAGAAVHESIVQITRDGQEVVKVTLEPAAGPAQAQKPGVPGAGQPVVVKAHAGAVRCLAFLPDGKVLATGGDDQVVHLVDTATGRLLAALRGHTGPVVAVAPFPDGKTLATVGADGTVKLWDVATGKEVASLKLPVAVKSGALLPAGKVLATAGGKAVRVWDVSTGKQLVSLRHEDGVSAVVVAPDGRQLATASPDAIRVWDAATGKLVFLLKQVRAVEGVAFSPDGKRLASLSVDGTVRLWDAASGKEVERLRGAQKARSLAFSPDGRTLVVGAGNDTAGGAPRVSVLRIWDVSTGKLALAMDGQSGTVTVLAFSPDGKRLASGSSDGTVCIRSLAQMAGRAGKPDGAADPRRAELEDKLRAAQAQLEAERLKGQEQADAARRAEAEADRARAALQQAQLNEMQARRRAERALYAATIAAAQRAWEAGQVKKAEQLLDKANPELRQWEWHHLRRLGQGGSPRVLTHTAPVTAVAVAPDGRLVASGEDRTVRLWDAASGKEVRTFRGHKAGVTGVAFSPDGKYLASSSQDRTVRVWETSTGKAVLALDMHDRALAVAFSPDGRRLAASRADGRVVVLDRVKHQETATLRGPEGGCPGLAFGPDGKVLAMAGGTAFSVALWDVARGALVRVLSGHTGPVYGVAFSPDGKSLASAGAGGVVRVWDVTSGRETLAVKGHKRAVGCVAFSPDGRRIASAGADGLIKLWDAATGQETLTLRGHTGAVTSLAFAPDGNLLVSGSVDRSVRLWPAGAKK